MPFAPHTIAEHLTNSVNVPWSSAPPDIQKAAQAADQALVDHLNAISALEDAEVGIPMADAEWDAAGKAAVRAGKPLPNHDGPDAAKFVLQIAKEDEYLAGRKMSATRGALAGELSDTANRDAWREAIEKRVATAQTKLTKAAADLEVTCAEVAVNIAFSEFLGTWPNHLTPPAVTTPDPAGALRRLASAKVWTAPIPAGEATFQQPTGPDLRPAVWIVNDGGAIHDVNASAAEDLVNQPGWRYATEAEAKQQHLRNTTNQDGDRYRTRNQAVVPPQQRPTLTH